MLPSQQQMFERFMASDASWNGRFITGVLTTGIYCLPSCSAKKPLERNIRFFRHPNDAVEAGLRACRRCRPEDFYRNHDPDLDLLENLYARVSSSLSQFPTVAAIVGAAGISASSLHALTRRHYHSTPAAILRRERVRATAAALLETRRPILDIAFDLGFESASAFHWNFRKVAAMSPGDYRAIRPSHRFVLALPANYLPSVPLASHARDSTSLCDRMKGTTIIKALQLGGVPVVLSVTLLAGRAECHYDSARPLAPPLIAAVHSAAIAILGLGSDPSLFERRMLADPQLAPLIAGRRGLRIPQTATVFEGLLWSIVGQQVNLPFAFTLRNVVVELAGKRAGDGLLAHPDPEAVARLEYTDLERRQFSRRKAEYLIDTARLIASGSLAVEDLASAAATAVQRRLVAIRGIGPWSANYVMMRSCSFDDCVPLGDTGLTSGLQSFFALRQRPDPATTTDLMRRFEPFRSLATFHLWKRNGEIPQSRTSIS